MRHHIPRHLHSCQGQAFALNRFQSLPERHFPSPVSSIGSSYCLSCSRQRAGLIAFGTVTQSRPDPRMNRTPEHPTRLSLSRLLQSASLVTRFSDCLRTYLSSQLRNLVQTVFCNICMRQGPLFALQGRKLPPHELAPSDTRFTLDGKTD
jgi:hypothetical protein